MVRLRHLTIGAILAAAAVSPALTAQEAPDAMRLRPAASADAPGTPAVRPPRTYGTSQVSDYSVDAVEMDRLNSGVSYRGAPQALRYVNNFTGLALQAGLHLPTGALVTYLQLDFYDTSLSGEVQVLFEECAYDGSSCTPLYGIPACGDALMTICSGTIDAPGYGTVSTDMSSAGIVIDNFLKGYRIVVGNTSTDGSTAIGRVLVGYVLQVTPDPPFASFDDVPVGHPFHQYVEALLASQVTAGCGGNAYCPDAPLTRGQMAVFLAKALGLQWP